MELRTHRSAGLTRPRRLPRALPAFRLEAPNEFFALELTGQHDGLVPFKDASRTELLGRELSILQLPGAGVVRLDRTGQRFALNGQRKRPRGCLSLD